MLKLKHSKEFTFWILNLMISSWDIRIYSFYLRWCLVISCILGHCASFKKCIESDNIYAFHFKDNLIKSISHSVKICANMCKIKYPMVAIFKLMSGNGLPVLSDLNSVYTVGSCLHNSHHNLITVHGSSYEATCVH